MFNFSGVLARLRGLPMVAAAGATDTIPFGSNHTNSLILAEGQETISSEPKSVVAAL